MKSIMLIFAAALTVALAQPAFAVVETSTTTTTIDNRAANAPAYYDFERAYSGTKPSIGQERYARASYWNEFPRTTLAENQIREDYQGAIHAGFTSTVDPVKRPFVISDSYVPADDRTVVTERREVRNA